MKKLSFLSLSSVLLATASAYALDCATPPTCADLGYTDTVANCVDAIKCPFDTTLGKCISSATVGQIGYFPIEPSGNWVLCDGRYLGANMYPELFAVLGTTFGGTGTTFRVPDYRGDFVRVLGGNSGGVNYRQSEGLPNISGHFGMNSKTLGDDALFTKVTMTSNYEGIGNGDMTKSAVKFDASKYNPIYGNSTHVTPVNTAVYAYIYAGRIDTSAAYASAVLTTDCKIGAYYYTDNTCSSSLNTNKTLKGIVYDRLLMSGYSYIKYYFGGCGLATRDVAENKCDSTDPSGGIASAKSVAPVLGSKITSATEGVCPISTSYVYLNSKTSNLVYSCKSTTSCISSASIVEGSAYYYYCQASDYFY